ncbi:chemotaxis protein CheC [Burkholderia pseudomallei]|uniref:chemotaxis protein CheC n=1 Tax=Burkholderia pseudomallei TaxID=28450 RepID=UPI00016A7011|nr:chemotaxis protein CheC [Burkholderia pseudomallei]OMZ32545.1 chemotaxis protein CheC [Burkholderia pseudomallei]ONC37802.1 chemotaxis protein CheC [Burkholderia pseudomallei]
MNDIALTEEHRDALQEISNIGMGRAGAALAKLLGAFVTLSVPDIKFVSARELLDELQRCERRADMPRPVRQSFQSDICGEALVLFGSDGRRELKELMGYDDATDDIEDEALSDIASLLVGACVHSVFEQLDRRLTFLRPTFVPPGSLASALGDERLGRWDVALLLEVHFTLEHGGFVAKLVMLLPDAAIHKMKAALEQFLDAL